MRSMLSNNLRRNVNRINMNTSRRWVSSSTSRNVTSKITSSTSRNLLIAAGITTGISMYTLNNTSLLSTTHCGLFTSGSEIPHVGV